MAAFFRAGGVVFLEGRGRPLRPLALSHSAVSQRDHTQYYQHILKQEEQICQAVEAFFSQHVQYNFLDEDCEFSSFSS